MRKLSDAAAAVGVALGWYGNNCPETHGIGRGPKYCGEHGKLPANWLPALRGDVEALIRYNFSSVKLDNPDCGANGDMQAYYDLVAKASPGRPIVIENCHYNTSYPHWADHPGGVLACPMHLYRVSNDIKANWESIQRNALATIPYADATNPLSRPGCWAYPDMLEVGVAGQNGHSEGGLTFAEERTHFGQWCVISSPLTLSFDLGNSTVVDAAWPIVTNTEALAVSQSYYGHPGTLLDEDKDNAGGAWQVWGKPQGNGATAILVINMLPETQSFRVPITAYGKGQSAARHVRDIWTQKDVGVVTDGVLRVDNLPSHDSMFLLVAEAPGL